MQNQQMASIDSYHSHVSKHVAPLCEISNHQSIKFNSRLLLFVKKLQYFDLLDAAIK